MSPLFPSCPVFTGQSVSQQICDFLRLAIIEGTLKPNQRLVEKSIADELRVSRTPVREALHRLEVEGLIEYVPGRRVVVRQFSPEEIAEVYDLRALLEGYAARLAATRIQPHDLLSLEGLCTSFEATLSDDRDPIEQLHKLVDLNSKFHATIIRASESQRLARTVRLATEIPLIYRSYRLTEQHRKTSCEYHQRITAALKEKDAAEAERLMQEHLAKAKTFILNELSKGHTSAR